MFITSVKEILFWPLRRLGLTYPITYVLLALRKRFGWQFIPYSSQAEPLFQLRRVMHKSKSVLSEMAQLSVDGPIVLFPHMRGQSYGLAFETLLAQRLRFDGARPIFLACQDLPLCDNRYIDEPADPDICRYCLQTSKAYTKQMNLPLYTLSDLVSEESYKKAYEFTRSLALNSCFHCQYRGVPIGELCEVSVTHYLCLDVQESASSEALQTWRDFLTGAIVLVDAYDEALSRFKPDILFVWNGRFFWNSVVLWMAQRRGIRIVSYETGLRNWEAGKYWLFRQEIAAAELDLTRPWRTWRDVPLTSDEDSQLDKEMQRRTNDPVYYPDPVKSREIILNELGLKDDKPVVAMFPNLTWDSTVIGRRTIFKSVIEWVKETIRFAKRNRDFSLVIRVHPAETIDLGGRGSREHVVDDIRREFGDLPDNIWIIPPDSKLSSYTLLDMASLVLVYTGTIGLEASINAKSPVIICGRAHYADKGFGYFPQSREEYFELLSNFNQLAPPSEQESALARRLAYLYWFRTIIPLQFFARNRRGRITHFTLDSLEDLLPGRNSYLDLIANGILTGDEIVLPRELERERRNNAIFPE
jgi:hypothetical protein